MQTKLQLAQQSYGQIGLFEDIGCTLQVYAYNLSPIAVQCAETSNQVINFDFRSGRTKVYFNEIK